MTTKELFENLLAGKKMRRKWWSENAILYLDAFGNLKYDNGFGSTEFTDSIIISDDWAEYKEEILTEKEKEYLRAVIKPFRDRVKTIWKRRTFENSNDVIAIQLEYDLLILPHFEQDTMYKGMEVNKKYTLEELGL